MRESLAVVETNDSLTHTHQEKSDLTPFWIFR